MARLEPKGSHLKVLCGPAEADVLALQMRARGGANGFTSDRQNPTRSSFVNNNKKERLC